MKEQISYKRMERLGVRRKRTSTRTASRAAKRHRRCRVITTAFRIAAAIINAHHITTLSITITEIIIVATNATAGIIAKSVRVKRKERVRHQ